MAERLTEEEVVERMRRKVQQAGSRAKVAEEIGVSETYIGDIINRKRAPGTSILNALRLRKIKTIEYEPVDGSE